MYKWRSRREIAWALDRAHAMWKRKGGWHDMMRLDEVPELPACYAVVQSWQAVPANRLVYIGKTENLARRMQQHHWDEETVVIKGECVECDVRYRVPRKYGEEAMLEQRLLAWWKKRYGAVPRLNVGPGRRRGT